MFVFHYRTLRNLTIVGTTVNFKINARRKLNGHGFIINYLGKIRKINLETLSRGSIKPPGSMSIKSSERGTVAIRLFKNDQLKTTHSSPHESILPFPPTSAKPSNVYDHSNVYANYSYSEFPLDGVHGKWALVCSLL